MRGTTENRLTSVTLPSTAVVSFKYDPLGRRIQKATSSATTIYAFDGANVVEETNAAGTAQARFVMGLNIDEPLAQLRSSATHFYSADGLGSITSLTNGSGTVSSSYTYDTFGNLAASTGSVVNPFRYTAREWDAELGLYFYRARYYDQTVGRFLSEDPIGFGSGGPNFYSYVLNTPTLFADPEGLQHQEFGPLHPDKGVKIRCHPDDSCPVLQSKIATFEAVIVSHRIWDLILTPGRHTNEIQDFEGGLARCQEIYAKKNCQCGPMPPLGVPVREWQPKPVPQPVPPTVVPTVVKVGSAALGGYAAYRVIRLLPSLLPPLWVTLIPNLVTP